MTETDYPLSDIKTLNAETADQVREVLEYNLVLPEDIEIDNLEAYPCKDRSGDWVIAEVELTPDRVASIYALQGAYTFQIYDGEEFKETTKSVRELNKQLANILYNTNIMSELERDYTVEPQPVSDNISLAPTMAGGIAVLVEGEHVDHLEKDELEELGKQVSAALETLQND
jgi:hypothetical protein